MPQIEIDRTEELSKEIVDKRGDAARIIEFSKMVNHMGLCGGDFDSEDRLKHLIDKIGRSLRLQPAARCGICEYSCGQNPQQ